MREIIAHVGLITDTQQGHSAVGKKITKFHCAMRYWDIYDFSDTKITGISQGSTVCSCLQREGQGMCLLRIHETNGLERLCLAAT